VNQFFFFIENKKSCSKKHHNDGDFDGLFEFRKDKGEGISDRIGGYCLPMVHQPEVLQGILHARSVVLRRIETM
jgi:hypothetical protein